MDLIKQYNYFIEEEEHFPEYIGDSDIHILIGFLAECKRLHRESRNLFAYSLSIGILKKMGEHLDDKIDMEWCDLKHNPNRENIIAKKKKEKIALFKYIEDKAEEMLKSLEQFENPKPIDSSKNVLKENLLFPPDRNKSDDKVMDRSRALLEL